MSIPEHILRRMSEQLDRINTGRVDVELQSDDKDGFRFRCRRPYSGRFLWVDEDGWRWCVFVDAGEWDYLEFVDPPEGIGFRMTYDDMPLNLYDHPDDEVQDTIWKVAGHCGKFVKDEEICDSDR